ncbi:hypothetical protein PIB30_091943 [Stylosanthes scabra]|uniref:Uncharacterized protein n=1 Tax=Stylosanthes scabra TaxID=79078 RepID=A0ABU6VTX4_9FABA|nr:hypothetical protein [Stylosanthes scabra]
MGYGRAVPRCATTRLGECAESEGGICYSHGMFRRTPYYGPGMQALIPEWMRSHREIYTWRSAVPVVCFNFVHMHHVDRVLRQYGGEQPVPRAPVDVMRFMSSTGRGDDVWWPERLATWYEVGPMSQHVVMCPHRRPSSQCCSHKLLLNWVNQAFISGRSFSNPDM